MIRIKNEKGMEYLLTMDIGGWILMEKTDGIKPYTIVDRFSGKQEAINFAYNLLKNNNKEGKVNVYNY